MRRSVAEGVKPAPRLRPMPARSRHHRRRRQTRVADARRYLQVAENLIYASENSHNVYPEHRERHLPRSNCSSFTYTDTAVQHWQQLNPTNQPKPLCNSADCSEPRWRCRPSRFTGRGTCSSAPATASAPNPEATGTPTRLVRNPGENYS